VQKQWEMRGMRKGETKKRKSRNCVKGRMEEKRKRRFALLILQRTFLGTRMYGTAVTCRHCMLSILDIEERMCIPNYVLTCGFPRALFRNFCSSRRHGLIVHSMCEIDRPNIHDGSTHTYICIQQVPYSVCIA
jgi:hypothetical protein